MWPFPELTFRQRYGTRAQYATAVSARLAELTREGWFLPEYASLVREDIDAIMSAAR